MDEMTLPELNLNYVAHLERMSHDGNVLVTQHEYRSLLRLARRALEQDERWAKLEALADQVAAEPANALALKQQAIIEAQRRVIEAARLLRRAIGYGQGTILELTELDEALEQLEKLEEAL